jgi:hypothetical protein
MARGGFVTSASSEEKDHGARHSALAAWGSNSHHHPACLGVALMAAVMEGPFGEPRSAVLADSLSARAAVIAAPAVSWAAIIGGAFTAVAITLILLELGAGLGLAAISPWPNVGPSSATFSIVTGIWLIVVQWIAAGFGGYIAGRLRTKWVGVHSDEIFFRDTVHGFLSWAVATLVGVVFALFAVFASVSGTVGAVTTVATGAAQTLGQAAVQRADNSSGGSAYFTDMLFRSDAKPGADDATRRDVRAEAGRILTTDLATGDVTSTDRSYLAGLVATQTGLSQQDAEKRIDDVVAQMKAVKAKALAAADAARKAAASTAIIMALSLLIGAFIASTAGAIGGHRRDE